MNEYGLDINYFEKKLKLIVRDVSRYTPSEMERELLKYVKVAHDQIGEKDPEYINIELIKEYLLKHNKEIAIICRMDSQQNEYDHVFFLVDIGEIYPDSIAYKLDIMRMEDVAIWKETVENSMTLGLKRIDDFHNKI